ncbi:MAG TPA: AAA family ATPase, partial [Iamia sp.]
MGAGGDRFVGRAEELALLRRVATDDGPSAIVLSGPMGIGKSRLVDELGRQLRSEGGVVAVGRTWPDGDGPALWPWFEVLDTLGVDRDVLAGPAADRADRFARTLAALAALDPAPTLIVDDLHTADVETLLLTRLVVRAAGGWRGGIVGTRRPGPTGSDPVDALLDAIERDARLVPLDGLGLDEVAALLRRSEPTVADDVVRLVSDLTGGNPLRLRALAAVPPGRSGWVAARVEDDVEARLAALPPPARDLVAAAAVIGGTAGASELAAACGTTPATVAEAVGPAIASGLLAERAGGVVLTHDAVREIVLAGLRPADRGALHARLGAHLAGGTADDRGRGAQHALAAAELGVADLDEAVAVARPAAADLRRGPSLVAADALLERAVATTRARGHRPPADLLVERAETTLACGRLQDARRRFEEAAAEAERVDDRVSRARAALGLGGVWLGEHRESATAERVRQLQASALADLPADETVLRARLTVRIAAEDAYRRGTTDDLDALLAPVRATGDPSALVEGLSLVHHATMHPGLEQARLALADEQLLVGTASGAELSVLVALVWRAVDLFLVGDTT